MIGVCSSAHNLVEIGKRNQSDARHTVLANNGPLANQRSTVTKNIVEAYTGNTNALSCFFGYDEKLHMTSSKSREVECGGPESTASTYWYDIEGNRIQGPNPNRMRFSAQTGSGGTLVYQILQK